MDKPKEINLAIKENTCITSLLNEDETNDLINVLIEFKDFFTWSYNKMARLAPNVVLHKLEVVTNENLTKHFPFCMCLKIEQQVILEIKKLVKASLIKEEQYPTYLASIVLVKITNGQIYIYIDCRDLIKVYSKDKFSLPTL